VGTVTAQVYPGHVGVASERVVVVGWNAQWPAIARAETARIREVAAAAEHVGSTAVPGLPARPVIDLLVGVDSRGEEQRVGTALEAAGFTRSEGGERWDGVVLRRAGDPAIEVIVTDHDGAQWRDALALRDYLRRHPDEASSYGRSKRRWAEDRPTPDTYGERKRGTLETLTERARRWRLANPRG
jgi:dephospho-CoA kinase